MCGRFSLTATPSDLEDLFAVYEIGDFPPRYNIAPTQPILVIMTGESGQPGSNLPDRRALLVRWGLLPGWVRDVGKFPLLINARSETAASKNSFRAAMRHRRVLIPASGFYEWKRDGDGKPQPFWISPSHGKTIAFGGLMETWSEPGGSEMDTAAILTTSASSDIASIHHRMPVIIQPQDYARWLNCKTQEPRDVADLLEPTPPGFFLSTPVSSKVNKVSNTGPEIQHPVELENKPASSVPLPVDTQLKLI